MSGSGMDCLCIFQWSQLTQSWKQVTQWHHLKPEAAGAWDIPRRKQSYKVVTFTCRWWHVREKETLLSHKFWSLLLQTSVASSDWPSKDLFRCASEIELTCISQTMNLWLQDTWVWVRNTRAHCPAQSKSCTCDELYNSDMEHKVFYRLWLSPRKPAAQWKPMCAQLLCMASGILYSAPCLSSKEAGLLRCLLHHSRTGKDTNFFSSPCWLIPGKQK